VNSSSLFPHPEEILGFVETHSHLLALRFGSNGEVLAANAHAQEIIGPDLLAAGRTKIWMDFTGEISTKLAHISGHTERLQATIATASGLPETFHSLVIPTGDGFLLLGERDPSDLSRLRVELLEANRELNNLTRELHKKNAELKHLNNLKNEFLGIAAHDLRSPIANIYSLSDLLLEDAVGRLSEQHLFYLSTMRSLSDFMLRMLNDLLDITSIESGHLHLSMERTDLPALVSQAVLLNSLHASRKRIQLEWTPPASFPMALLDPAKIVQAIHNLISNAIKYSPSDSTVRVDLQASAIRWRFSVLDSGPGVPPAERERLFKPFSRLTAKPTDGEKSTGLGLAIVHKVLTAHGGQTGVEDRPDGQPGSSFFIEAPLNSLSNETLPKNREP